MNDFIHRFVPAPDGNVSTAPTLLLLHGTGGGKQSAEIRKAEQGRLIPNKPGI